MTNKGGYDYRPLFVPQVTMNGMELKLERYIENKENRIIQGPVKLDSKAVLKYFDQETGMVNIIDSLGNDFDMQINEIPNKIRDNTLDAS